MIATQFVYVNELDLQFLRKTLPDRVRPSIRLMDCDRYQGVVSDPISIHKYLYANDNAVDNADPTGRMSISELGVTMAVGGALLSLSGFGLKALGAKLHNDTLKLIGSVAQFAGGIIAGTGIGILTAPLGATGGALVGRAIGGGLGGSFVVKILSLVYDEIQKKGSETAKQLAVASGLSLILGTVGAAGRGVPIQGRIVLHPGEKHGAWWELGAQWQKIDSIGLGGGPPLSDGDDVYDYRIIDQVAGTVNVTVSTVTDAAKGQLKQEQSYNNLAVQGAGGGLAIEGQGFIRLKNEQD